MEQQDHKSPRVFTLETDTPATTSPKRRAKHVHVTSSPSEPTGVVKINKRDGTFEFVASSPSHSASPDSPSYSSSSSPTSVSEYETHKHHKKSCCSRAGLRIRKGLKHLRASFRYYFF